MTGTKHKANSELIGQGTGQHRRTVLWRYHRHGGNCPFCGKRPRGCNLANLSGYPCDSGDPCPAGACTAAFRLPLSAMAALLLMVAWNMSEAHKVVDLLRHAPKDDIIVMLMCMSLTVLFDMVIAISVGIVLASLLCLCVVLRA